MTPHMYYSESSWCFLNPYSFVFWAHIIVSHRAAVTIEAAPRNSELCVDVAKKHFIFKAYHLRPMYDLCMTYVWPATFLWPMTSLWTTTYVWLMYDLRPFYDLRPSCDPCSTYASKVWFWLILLEFDLSHQNLHLYF